MRKIGLLVAALAIALTAACTDQMMAKNYGGDMTIDLPCGQKLIEATWKDNNLWYLTRPMREDESPETYTFREDSNLGYLEGTVTFKECPVSK